MATCKTCGSKVGFWTGRDDGLCKACGAKADQAAKQDAARREALGKQRLLEGAKRNIEVILKAMTDESPVMYTFFNRGITTRKGNGTAGLIIGGVMFGAVGAVVGHALAGGGSLSFEGEVGVLVVTPTRIVAASCEAPFYSEQGEIGPEHLELLLDQLRSGTGVHEAFGIRRTQLSMESNAAVAAGTATADTVVMLGAGAEAFRFTTSALIVNDAAYEIPDATTVYGAIERLGALVSPSMFLDRLADGKNPVPAEQFEALDDRDRYIGDVFTLLLHHERRGALVENLGCLAPNVAEALEQRIGAKADGVDSAKATLGVSTILAAATGMAAVVTTGGARGIAALCAVVCVIVAICAAVSFSRATVCCGIIDRRSDAAALVALSRTAGRAGVVGHRSSTPSVQPVWSASATHASTVGSPRR
ncbi:MAG: hypothetical protein ACOC7R_04450 [Planctomycetota bacterium]